jgi:hypothetical protein
LVRKITSLQLLPLGGPFSTEGVVKDSASATRQRLSLSLNQLRALVGLQVVSAVRSQLVQSKEIVNLLTLSILKSTRKFESHGVSAATRSPGDFAPSHFWTFESEFQASAALRLLCPIFAARPFLDICSTAGTLGIANEASSHLQMMMSHSHCQGLPRNKMCISLSALTASAQLTTLSARMSQQFQPLEHSR